MKFFRIIFLVIFAVVLLSGCYSKGHSELVINGSESSLPDEIKGLNIYKVKIDQMEPATVAILNGVITTGGRRTGVTIVLPYDTIKANTVLYETDGILIIRKLKPE